MLYNSMGNPPQTAQYAAFATGTYNKGMAPCRLVVTGDGGGGFAVVDSLNSTLYAGGSYSPSGTPYGVVPAGVQNKQVKARQSCMPTLMPHHTTSCCHASLSSGDDLCRFAPELWLVDCHAQGTHIYSADATVFLTVQSDGNLVLYNTARFSTYGSSAAAAIWATDVFNANAPFTLTMQQVGLVSSMRVACCWLCPH